VPDKKAPQKSGGEVIKPVAAAASKPETRATAKQASFPIVGVGASAGGLEAFTQLLSALPEHLGMAFVCMPHLDPNRESAMTELLSHETKMPVLKAEHGMRVKPDHVYVIPPNTELTIANFVLQLSSRRRGEMSPPPVEVKEPAKKPVEHESLKRQINQLKHELAATKEYLQSIIEERKATDEELQLANEEIRSANEELRSTNEELQTSKEELESANEELNTVNKEMQHRNQQISQLTNDLTNLLNSVNMAIVMVGPDLRVRRFTLQAEKMLGLGSIDIGRPLSTVRFKMDLHDLEQKALDVIRDVLPQSVPLVDDNGNKRVIRITPYRTSENKIEGVVLTMPEGEAK
jgi:PAS domain-containing protein